MSAQTKDQFIFKNQGNGLIYTYNRKPLPDGRTDGPPAYRREDLDLWVTFRSGFGWGIWENGTEALLSIPWNLPPHEQHPQSPPEGIWVSRKGAKSYVYDLKYI